MVAESGGGSARDRVASGLEAIAALDMTAFGPSQWFTDQHTARFHPGKQPTGFVRVAGIEATLDVAVRDVIELGAFPAFVQQVEHAVLALLSRLVEATG